MTSVERQDDDYYHLGPGGDLVRRPPYSVISYTWGRFEVKTDDRDKRIRVEGIEWAVPAIDETHFTPKAFNHVLHTMLQTKKDDEFTDFAWVDIACIHQTNQRLKVYEIGQQGKIFQQAARVFLWFSRTSSILLSDIAQEYADIILEWREQRPALDRIGKMIGYLQSLKTDPYFRSLWTLQEAAGRRDARIFSSDACLFELKITLLPWLMNYNQQFFGSTWDEETVEMWQSYSETLTAILGEMGYMYLSNSSVYGPPITSRAAVAHRNPVLEQDRIFGTMSLYSITTRSVQSFQKEPYSYSLAELEHAFATAINKYDPIMGQWFIHTKEPATGQTWKMTRYVRSPNLTERYYNVDPSLKVIGSGKGHADFHGSSCSLATLRDPDSKLGIVYLDIELDDYLVEKYDDLQPRAKRSTAEWQDLENDFTVCDSVAATFRDKDIRLLQFGSQVIDLREQSTWGIVVLKLSDTSVKYMRIGIFDLLVPIGSDIPWKEFSNEIH